LYEDLIPELKKRTIAEAMAFEKKTTLACMVQEKQTEDEEKATYESYLAEDNEAVELHPRDYQKFEVAVTIESIEDTAMLKSSFQQNNQRCDHIVELKEKSTQHESGPINSEGSSSED
jgi:hypothetical protein